MRLVKGNVERVVESVAKIQALKNEGFKEMGDMPAPEKKEEKELSDMGVKELKDLAKQLGKEGCSGLNKEELLEVLKDVV